MAEQIPSPGVQKVFRAQRHDAWVLIAEVVANSFGAQRGQAQNVDIFYSQRDRLLSILDDGRGFGYTLPNGATAGLGLLFKLGEGAGLSSGRDDDLGQFGAGGSIFLLNLADTAELWSLKADGHVSHTRQDIHQVVDVSNTYFDVVDEWVPSIPNNTPELLSDNGQGTLIKVRLRKGKRITPSVIQKYLSRHFAERLRQGSSIVWHDVDAGDFEVLGPWDPGELQMSNERDVVVQGRAVHVRAAYAPSVSERDAGIELVFGTQTIAITKEPFGSYEGGKIYGWAYLAVQDWRDQLNADKTGLHDDDLWDELITRISEAIADVVEYVAEADIEEWAADLQLDAMIDFGPLAKQIEKADFDTTDWAEVADPPRKRKKRKGRPEGEDDSSLHAGIPIRVRPDTSGDLGRFVKVTVRLGEAVIVRFDATADAMKEARRPTNRQFYRYIVTDEFAAELVRQDLITRAGLFSEDEWDSLREKCDGDVMLMTSFVKPRLYERVRMAGAA